jgi:hypothetical protein
LSSAGREYKRQNDRMADMTMRREWPEKRDKFEQSCAEDDDESSLESQGAG